MSRDLPDLGRVAANAAMLKLLDDPALKEMGGGIQGALMRLGVSAADAARCVSGVKGGAVLEAVIVDDSKEAVTLDVMRRHATNGGRVRPDEEIVIPVIEEELRIGKRDIDAGGVRITTHVSALPVEKTVTVREERVNIERRIVDRVMDENDDSFRDKSMENEGDVGGARGGQAGAHCRRNQDSQGPNGARGDDPRQSSSH